MKTLLSLVLVLFSINVFANYKFTVNDIIFTGEQCRSKETDKLERQIGTVYTMKEINVSGGRLTLPISVNGLSKPIIKNYYTMPYSLQYGTTLKGSYKAIRNLEDRLRDGTALCEFTFKVSNLNDGRCFLLYRRTKCY